MKIKKLNLNATIPTRGTPYSAGSDLYACLDSQVIIQPHTTAMVGTGLAIAVPIGYAGFIYARSGLAAMNWMIQNAAKVALGVQGIK